MLELGQVAYDARFEKYKIPWHELTESEKNVWRKVAEAVLQAESVKR